MTPSPRLLAISLPLLLAACGRDIGFVEAEKPPVAEPPGKDDDPEGEPPDWNTCLQGWRGKYSNLPAGHRYVTPRLADEPMPTDPLVLNLWDEPEYEEFAGSIDWGENWWPVDEGLEDDPMYFAVYYQAWIRAFSGTTLSLLLGSSDDAWVYIDGEPVASLPGIHEAELTRFDVGLGAGQYPIEVYYVHRASPVSALNFRVLGGDVKICYPAWEDDPETP
jgi:fibro-slime domain-containing protein